MKVVLFVLVLAMLCGVASADTHTVCASGCDYTTIQAAVTAASSYDTVYVWNGTYTENIDVTTAHLTIEGEGRDVATVQAAVTSDHVFDITASYVNVSGFTVTGATDAGKDGFRVSSSRNCRIFDNNITGNSYGIYMRAATNNSSIENNICRFNTLDGITFADHICNNTIMNNNCSDNGNTGISFWTSCNDNIVDGNNCSYINGGSGSGICLYNGCSGNMIRNNTCMYNGAGIHFEGSSDNTVSGNNASNNNQWGIRIYYSSNGNLLVNNSAEAFFEYAFTDSVGNIIRNPADDTNSVRVWGTSDVLIENNDSAAFSEDSVEITRAYPNGNFSMYRSGAETFDITQHDVSVLPDDVLTVAVTTFTEPLKRWNESAASDMYAFFTVGEGTPGTTYVVNMYADANGSMMQTFRIRANSTGYLKYNTTGYGYDRWTEIRPAPEPPGQLVIIAVFGAVLVGGGWAIRRWVKKD